MIGVFKVYTGKTLSEEIQSNLFHANLPVKMSHLDSKYLQDIRRIMRAPCKYQASQIFYVITN